MEAATAQRMVIIIGVAATLFGMLTGAASVFFMRLKDKREAAAQKNDDVELMVVVKDATISSLDTQNNLLLEQVAELKRQGEAREREWLKRELDWKSREDKLERRVVELERDYRALVLTVTSMGLCAKSSTCPNYSIGDRLTQSGGKE